MIYDVTGSNQYHMLRTDLSQAGSSESAAFNVRVTEYSTSGVHLERKESWKINQRRLLVTFTS